MEDYRLYSSGMRFYELYIVKGTCETLGVNEVNPTTPVTVIRAKRHPHVPLEMATREC